jgi:putative methionine-R-sulfoxide reductase with GAF domain
VGLLGLIGIQGLLSGPLTGFASWATGSQAMPIDLALLAKSIATLTDLDPERDLARTLEQAVLAAKQLFMVDAAGVMLADIDGKLRWASASDQRARTLEGSQESFAAGPCTQAFATGRPAIMHDATLEPRWEAVTLAFVELQIRSALSVPVELGGGPIGTLDVYAVAPGGWDETEVSALQAYAGVVATLLGTAARAAVKGRLADQLQVALNSRVQAEQAREALMECERLEDQPALVDLRRAAWSSRRELSEAAEDRAPPLDMATLDAQVVAFLEQKPHSDGGIGHSLSLLVLGFLSTELVPLADRLAGLGIDSSPLLAATGDILRLYADTLERPTLPGDAPDHA